MEKVDFSNRRMRFTATAIMGTVFLSVFLVTCFIQRGFSEDPKQAAGKTSVSLSAAQKGNIDKLIDFSRQFSPSTEKFTAVLERIKYCKPDNPSCETAIIKAEEEYSKLECAIQLSIAGFVCTLPRPLKLRPEACSIACPNSSSTTYCLKGNCSCYCTSLGFARCYCVDGD